MTSKKRVTLGLTAALLLTLGMGCHEVSHRGDVSGPGSGPARSGRIDDVAGELRHVDHELRRLEVRIDQGYVQSVRYDGYTRVWHREQEYPPDRLEPGDRLSLRLEMEASGDAYAHVIRVREKTPSQGEGIVLPKPRERLRGKVERIDYRRGLFELRERDRQMVLISLPYNPRQRVAERFQALQVGDFVTVDGVFVNRDRFELEAFVS